MPDSGLQAVFLAERAMLLRLLTARLGDASDAEDALQDIWLRIATGNLPPIATPAAYLYRMATHIATDRRMAATRRGTLETAWTETQPDATEYPDAERQLESREALDRARAIMAAMPDRMRTAYTMFRIDRMPQRQIAEQLGISLSAVEKLLQRAYRRFHAAQGEADND
jgi:RNA polymerase sigma factor (sigma-70 family)